MENLGSLRYPEFISVFRRIDWGHEVIQAEWAKKASPTLAVTNQNDGCALWVSAAIAGSYIDVDAEADERFKVDKYEPWYSVGMTDPPKFSNVTALDAHSIGNEIGFTAFSTGCIEECFELFFEEDYQSLYELFRWV